MDNSIRSHIETCIEEYIENVAPISGGDISRAFKIKTSKTSYFVKINSNPEAFSMFKAESMGLERIAKTKIIAVPKVIEVGVVQSNSFLILSHIASKRPTEGDMARFGIQLAKLHQTSNNHFGLEHDNFIGSLPQSNSQDQDWMSFYIHERLIPQFKLAQANNYLKHSEIPSEEKMVLILKPLFETVRPSLLHGDLWSGNYLIAEDGTPYLIDPAVYFGHSEVDIAMSLLFGGFSSKFYEGYNDILPSDSYTKSRIEIYQLYYLLVHLNLFGMSYAGSVRSIITKFF